MWAGGRSRRVTQRCHNSPDGKRGYRVRVTSRTGSARRILKKSVELSPASEEDGSLARRSQANGLCGRCHTCWGGGGRWKSRNRKNVYLTPYVKEPLNSKVIKSFVPEQRSRKCFSCFEIPMFYVYIYIYIYEHFMSISYIHIWLWYICSSLLEDKFLIAHWQKKNWSHIHTKFHIDTERHTNMENISSQKKKKTNKKQNKVYINTKKRHKRRFTYIRTLIDPQKHTHNTQTYTYMHTYKSSFPIYLPNLYILML